MPFHIMVEGSCWMKMDGQQYFLAAGDVLAFPFGTGHQLGAGAGGRLITPVKDLPPKPWREIPILRYGDGRQRVRLLCGYLQCDALRFRPLQNALPKLLHVRTRGANDADWLRATIAQIVAEVDRPRTGGLSMLERLTEITFIELLRHQIDASKKDSGGWLAALADPSLGRCLVLIHDNPRRDWSVQDLAAAAGLSRSTLATRFETVLDTSPMRYLRDWRLYLASVGTADNRPEDRRRRGGCRLRHRGRVQPRLLAGLRRAAGRVAAEFAARPLSAADRRVDGAASGFGQKQPGEGEPDQRDRGQARGTPPDCRNDRRCSPRASG